MAAFGGAFAVATAVAITEATAVAITADTAVAITADTATTLVVRVGVYKTESASRIAATETPFEAASVGGLFIWSALLDFLFQPYVKYELKDVGVSSYQ